MDKGREEFMDKQGVLDVPRTPQNTLSLSFVQV